jgi:uncharacterized protein (TIGR02466 family)
MKTYSIFPEPVSVFKYDDNLKVLKNVRKIIESTKADGYQDGRSWWQNDVLKKSEFKGLHDFIVESANTFAKDVVSYKYQNFILLDSWINLCDRGGFQYRHNHSNCIISGTYYPKFISGNAPIAFQKQFLLDTMPFPYFQIQKDYENLTEFSFPAWEVTPESGDLLLWNSHLPHGYNAEPVGDRISISFNMISAEFSSGIHTIKVQQ